MWSKGGQWCSIVVYPITQVGILSCDYWLLPKFQGSRRVVWLYPPLFCVLMLSLCPFINSICESQIIDGSVCMYISLETFNIIRWQVETYTSTNVRIKVNVESWKQ